MTVRQLAHRPRRLIPPRLLAAGTAPREPRGWQPLAGGLGIDRAPQSGPTAPPEITGTFQAVGRRRAFSDGRAFWAPGDDGLLFAFCLHGFAELARYAAQPPVPERDAFWQRVLASWLAAHAAPRMPAWHPYPTSGRITAWCAALSRGGWQPALSAQMRRSLVRQAAVLSRSVEHDIGGNHVLRNAGALVVAGVCLGDARLERRGLTQLRRELARQILADGGHEERSTAYHRAVRGELVDVAELLDRGGRDVPQWLSEAADRMAGWERALRGPDGRLPLLNDAWEGPPEPVERARDAVEILAPSGFVVLRHRDDQAVYDVGLLAPRHLPPHAHADALSFVLWADGRQLVSDPGSFAYDGPERNAFRGTAAHNTVLVDGLDQCELWGSFRAAFMPRVELHAVEAHGDARVVVGSHDGYRRLADPVRHRRSLCWLPGDGIVVVDELLASRSHGVLSRLHLAPGVAAADGMVGPLRLAALGRVGTWSVVRGRYAPYLGRAEAIDVVEQAREVEAGEPFGWALLRPGAHAALDGRRLTVQRAGAPLFELDL